MERQRVDTDRRFGGRAVIGPTEDRVVILPEPEFRDKAGIIVPTRGQGANIGVIVAVGPGRYTDLGQFIPQAFTPGMVVAYTRYGGVDIRHQGEDYLLIGARDVLGIIDDAEPMPEVVPVEGGVEIHFGNPRDIARAQGNGG